MSIVYKGKEVPCIAEVVDGRTVKFRGQRCWWDLGEPGTRKRTQPIEVVVVHHTAGEGNATAIHKTLRNRRTKGGQKGLAVHFTVDRDGRIVQQADLDTVCFHGGIQNGRSIGIETACSGWPHGKYTAASTKREVYQDVLRGKPHKYFKLFDEQLASLILLCQDLCDMFGLPRKFPRTADGKALRETLTPQAALAHRGLIGHLQYASMKGDPPPYVMDEIMSALHPSV